MKTAILIDETDNPVTIRIDPREVADRSKPFLTWAVMGQQPRSYKLVREEGELMYFRLATGTISDQHFDLISQVEAEKIEHPERFADRVLYPEMFRKPMSLPVSGQRAR